MVLEGGEGVFELEVELEARGVVVGEHVEADVERGEDGFDGVEVGGSEESGGGDGDGFVAGGEHGPAVGRAFGEEEVVAVA